MSITFNIWLRHPHWNVAKGASSPAEQRGVYQGMSGIGGESRILRCCATNRTAEMSGKPLPSGRKAGPPDKSLRLARLACDMLGRALPAEMRENEWTVARAAGQSRSIPGAERMGLPLASSGCCAMLRDAVRSSRPLGGTAMQAQPFSNPHGAQAP
jgi:hypothetical protein